MAFSTVSWIQKLSRRAETGQVTKDRRCGLSVVRRIQPNNATPEGVGDHDGICVWPGRGAGAGAVGAAASKVRPVDRQGVSNFEACRLVGVERRTGTRRRFGRTVTFKSGSELHYPPMATTRATWLSARFLPEDERVLIADRVRAGASLCAIGRELGRPASTVSRRCAATVMRPGAITRSTRTGWLGGVLSARRSAGWLY